MIEQLHRLSRPVGRLVPLLLLGGLLLLAGCVTTTNDRPVESADDKYRITGIVTYRERIALPPDSVVTVVLEDISLADRAADKIEEAVASNVGQVPLQFGLIVDAGELDPRHRYAVRATIHDGQGNLLWTTDTVYPVDPRAEGANLGELILVRVGGR